MRIVFAVVLAVLTTAGFMSVILFDHFTGHMPWVTSEPEGVIREVIQSKVLAEDREIIIHLPRDYDSTARYPVMYVLDGGSEDRRIADKFEILSAVGCSAKTIVVGIPNMTRKNRELNLVPPFMRIDVEDPESPPGGGQQFLSFMESELFPFIERNYPASQERLLSGNSRGGLLVMYSLLYKPALFRARFCYSTPFWRQDHIFASKISSFLASKDTLNTFLYMSAGANETENIRSGVEEMTSVFSEKTPAGFTWHAEFTPNAVHRDNARISSIAAIALWSQYRKSH